MAIGKNPKVVIIAVLAGNNSKCSGYWNRIVLARHHDNIKVFENSDNNVQTETGQSKHVKPLVELSPISDSCIASSSNTFSQEGGVVQSPTQGASVPTSRVHSTTLALNPILPPPALLPPPAPRPSVVLTGILTDTITGLGNTGATITFTGTGVPSGLNAVTDATGTFTVSFPAPPPGTYTAQAHFSGQGIFGASNSGTQNFDVNA